MSITETWSRSQSMRCVSGSGASAPLIRWPQWKRAPSSRRRNAETVPARHSRPSRRPSSDSCSSISSQSSSKVRMRRGSPASSETDRRRRVRDVLGFAVECDLDARHEVGDLAALVAGLGEHEPKQPLADDVADRPEVGRTPSWRLPVSGTASPPPRRTGAQNPTELEGPGGQPELARSARGSLVGQAACSAVEEQEVLALDVEDQRLGVRRLAAEHAGVEERVEQEARVASSSSRRPRRRRCSRARRGARRGRRGRGRSAARRARAAASWLLHAVEVAEPRRGRRRARRRGRPAGAAPRAPARSGS